MGHTNQFRLAGSLVASSGRFQMHICTIFHKASCDREIASAAPCSAFCLDHRPDSKKICCVSYMGVSIIGGTPSHHPFINGFSLINHPAIGIPPLVGFPSCGSPRPWRSTPSAVHSAAVLQDLQQQPSAHLSRQHCTAPAGLSAC